MADAVIDLTKEICSICRDEENCFETKCGHFFCGACVKKCVKFDYINCAICRAVNVIPIPQNTKIIIDLTSENITYSSIITP